MYRTTIVPVAVALAVGTVAALPGHGGALPAAGAAIGRTGRPASPEVVG